MCRGEVLKKPLGADAGPPAKEPLRMKGAETQVSGQFVERWLLGPVLTNPGNGALDAVVVRRHAATLPHDVRASTRILL